MSRMLVSALVKDNEIVGEAPTSGQSRQRSLFEIYWNAFSACWWELNICFPMRRQRHVFLHVRYCDGSRR